MTHGINRKGAAMNAMTDLLEDTVEREIATKRSTWVSTAVNLSLTVAQMAAGIFSGANQRLNFTNRQRRNFPALIYIHLLSIN